MDAPKARVSNTPGKEGSPPARTRLIVYVVYAADGRVDDFVLYALRALRPHATHLTVVVNGFVDEDGQGALRGAADTLLFRDNGGFDIWGYKHAIDHHGPQMARYDELVLTNDTWYGPLRPFAPVFERMDATDVDFWGMTEHAAEDPSDGANEGIPRHLQSFWVAVRRPMLGSPQWREYWRDLPAMPGYWDAVALHELRFTGVFEAAGFRSGAAFPSDDYPPGNTAILLPDLLLRDGCPLLKRRVFHHYPPYFHRHALVGRWVLREAGEESDYPMGLITANLARTTSPRVLNVDAGLLEVVSDAGTEEVVPPETERIVAILSADDPASLADQYELAQRVPGLSEIVARVPASLVDAATALLSSSGSDAASVTVSATDVPHGARRVLDAAATIADESAIVIALHYGLPDRADPGFNASTAMIRQAADSLVGSRRHSARVLDLFAREPGLGVVLPPLPHIGFEPPASASTARDDARRELGIRVPTDAGPALAPIAGIWIARSSALRILTADHRGVALDEKVLIDLLVSAAGELGMHHRTVLSTRQAAIAHTSMEYKVDEMLASTWGYPLDQIQTLQRLSWQGRPGLRQVTRKYLAVNHSSLTQRLLGLRGRLRELKGRVIR